MNQQEMTERIKLLLGSSGINVEISDEAISSNTQVALLMAKDHMYVKRYKTYVVESAMGKVIPRYSFKVDLSDLDFDVVTEVYRGDSLSPYLYDGFFLTNYAARGVPASYAMAINMISNLDALLNRSWKVIDKTLFLDKYYGAITVEFVPKIIGLEDIDDSFWEGWILRYTLALCKETLSRIRGKFVVDSNPFKVDYDILANEARDEKIALMEEIKDKGLLLITR